MARFPHSVDEHSSDVLVVEVECELRTRRLNKVDDIYRVSAWTPSLCTGFPVVLMDSKAFEYPDSDSQFLFSYPMGCCFERFSPVETTARPEPFPLTGSFVRLASSTPSSVLTTISTQHWHLLYELAKEFVLNLLFVDLHLPGDMVRTVYLGLEFCVVSLSDYKWKRFICSKLAEHGKSVLDSTLSAWVSRTIQFLIAYQR